MDDMALDPFLPLNSHHQLYRTGLQHATRGLVSARTLRYNITMSNKAAYDIGSL